MQLNETMMRARNLLMELLLFCRLESHVDTPLAEARTVATAMTSINAIRGLDSVAAAGGSSWP